MTEAGQKRQCRRLTIHLMSAATLWVITAVLLDLRHASALCQKLEVVAGAAA